MIEDWFNTRHVQLDAYDGASSGTDMRIAIDSNTSVGVTATAVTTSAYAVFANPSDITWRNPR